MCCGSRPHQLPSGDYFASSTAHLIVRPSSSGSKVNVIVAWGSADIPPSRQRRGAGLGGEQERGPRLLAECEPQMGRSAQKPGSSMLRIQLNYCSDPETNQTLGG